MSTSARHDESPPARVGGDKSGNGDWVPRPDPTTLTQDIVTTAKTDLRRELSAARELIEARMQSAEDNINRIEDRSARERENIKEATDALHRELDRRLHAHDIEDGNIRGEITTQVTGLERLHEERFKAIQQQFTERDTRGEQEKKSSKEALDAALLAQKESVSQQNDANTTAATKSETSFTKQIDQIGTLIATLEKSLTDRITELKERIDRGEGGMQGTRDALSDRRASVGQVIAACSASFLAISIIVTVIIAAVTHGFH